MINEVPKIGMVGTAYIEYDMLCPTAISGELSLNTVVLTGDATRKLVISCAVTPVVDNAIEVGCERVSVFPCHTYTTF